MDIQTLKNRIQQAGIVGAGGAGFPTYMKIDERADIILLNCAECEPLLTLHRQLLEQYPYEILNIFQILAETMNAQEAIIGIKKEYRATIDALKIYMDGFPRMRLHLLDSVYPMGDEMVLIYETTGKVIRPGGLPIEECIAVFNVETIYNTYRYIEKQQPVTDKLITINGEVSNPVTVRVPIGMAIEDVVSLAGNITVKEPAYLVGGPMMGNICHGKKPVTKTTNAILVLDNSLRLIRSKDRSSSIDLKRAASVCCQCQMCTDLCPRHALGHPIEPHRFMRSASNKDFQDTNVFLNTMFCNSCGLCEVYSCPQSLSPRTLIAEYKNGLRSAGIKGRQDVVPMPVSDSRAYRKVPEDRLKARLGLSKYVSDAILDNHVVEADSVEILLGQHIGAPAKAVVSVGDIVETGQIIADAGQGLSVSLHASISGIVVEVNVKYIKIRKNNSTERM